ncbi:MAG TPA: adenosine deaminase [Candidatus Dormibacteraeota bacterium]
MSSYRAWPKAELHFHLDGALRPSTVGELVESEGLDVPRPFLLTAPDATPSLVGLFEYFELPINVMQTEASLERVAYEACVDAAADGIDYIEVRWGPLLHTRRGLSVEAGIGAVLSGLEAAPIRAVGIACALRQDPPEANVEMARVAGAFAGRGLVGFDLAGDEARYPPGLHARAFEAARAAGLRLTCHAGEAAGPESVEGALRLGVERVAHGVSVAEDAALGERVAREGIVLDVCPTSNWKTKAVRSLEQHPLPRLIRSGVRCTISTDAPTVIGGTLSHEYELCSRVLGLTDDELRACDLTARAAAFG